MAYNSKKEIICDVINMTEVINYDKIEIKEFNLENLEYMDEYTNIMRDVAKQEPEIEEDDEDVTDLEIRINGAAQYDNIYIKEESQDDDNKEWVQYNNNLKESQYSDLDIKEEVNVDDTMPGEFDFGSFIIKKENTPSEDSFNMSGHESITFGDLVTSLNEYHILDHNYCKMGQIFIDEPSNSFDTIVAREFQSSKSDINDSYLIYNRCSKSFNKTFNGNENTYKEIAANRNDYMVEENSSHKKINVKKVSSHTGFNTSYESKSDLKVNEIERCRNAQHLTGNYDDSDTSSNLNTVVNGVKRTEKSYKSDCASRKDSLDVHTKPKRITERPFKYRYDYIQVRKLYHLSRRIRTTKEELYQCSDCDYSALTKSDLDIHVKIKHTVEPVKGNICEFSAMTNPDLKYRIKTNTGERPFKCTECDYSALRKDTLDVHVRSKHTLEKPFKCTDCDYSTSRKDLLVIHIKGKHTLEKPFKCTDCDYSTSRKDLLVIHIKGKHTLKKPFKCTDCEYRTSRKSALDVHVKYRHTIERPFKCSYCDHRTVIASELKRHKRIHTGEKPFKCSDCDYKTLTKNHLKRHRRIHTREKPFKCNVCDYSSANNFHVIRHMKIHTKEKTG